MNNTSVLQVRLPIELRNAAEAKAQDMGLSSLQDAVRVFLKRMIAGDYAIGLVKQPDEQITLTPKASKRFSKMITDFKHDQNVVAFDDPQDALTWLKR